MLISVYSLSAGSAIKTKRVISFYRHYFIMVTQLRIHTGPGVVNADNIDADIAGVAKGMR
jgi:hypothetical protein